MDVPPLAGLREELPELMVEIERIMEKKSANRTVMPEEYTTLSKFADMIERRLLASRDAKRQERIQEINAVKDTLPQGAFLLPVDKLDISDDMIEALLPLGTVGEIMLRFLIDEQRVVRLLENLSADAMPRLQAALDQIVIPEVVDGQVVVAEEEAPAEMVEAVSDPGAEDSLIPDAFADEPAVFDPTAVPEIDRKRKVVAEPAFEPDEMVEDEEVDLLMTGAKRGKGDKKKKKKERQQRRQLIFDEEIGQVIAKRRRKGSRGGDDWGEAE
jgi:hypothetical protein